MNLTRLSRSAILLQCFLFAVASLCAGETDPARAEAMKVIAEAKAAVEAIPLQAEALAHLAWSRAENDNPLVAALAREELAGFGRHGISALRNAAKWAPDIYAADVAATAIEANTYMSSDVDPDFYPTLDQLLWEGSVDAKRVVIPVLARHGYRPGILPAIDATYLYPELLELVIDTLPDFRDALPSLFLFDILVQGDPHLSPRAAKSLAKIGGVALDSLRQAVHTDNAFVRSVALNALLPVTGVDDLTTLHEFVALQTDEDPELVERVRLRAIQLESLLERRYLEAAESEFE